MKVILPIVFRTITFFFLILFSSQVTGQKSFVRIYDLGGKKITKGRILLITDSTIQLSGKSSNNIVYINGIGLVKTKRSGGHNVLIGDMIGVATLGIIGAASVNPQAFIFNSTGEGFIIGGVFGLIVGTIGGELSILFKHSKSYLINGDVTKWKAFKDVIVQ